MEENRSIASCCVYLRCPSASRMRRGISGQYESANEAFIHDLKQSKGGPLLLRNSPRLRQRSQIGGIWRCLIKSSPGRLLLDLFHRKHL